MRQNRKNSIIHCSDKKQILAIKDAENVINGKWKLAIICILLTGSKRFSEIQHTIEVITPRMVSKQLKELEINGVVKRNVIASTPVTIEYELTPSGKKLNDVIMKMAEWGLQHRQETIIKK